MSNRPPAVKGPLDERPPDDWPVAPLEAARRFVLQLKKPAHILLAVSGGSDSTGLLFALHRVVSESFAQSVSLQAVTVDHGLRAGSAAEAAGVAALCARLGIAHAVLRWTGPKPATGLAAAARLARYRLLAEAAVAFRADGIVTAHTLDDQRETIAMRRARSRGDDDSGLSGMAAAVLYGARHWVLRPFLGCERQAIRAMLLAASWNWYDDPSNEDRRFERVRMRERLAAQAGQAAAQEADAGRPRAFPGKALAARRAALSGAAASWLAAHARNVHGCLVGIDGRALAPGGVGQEVRHALAAVAAALGGRAFFLSSASLDRVMAFVTDGAPGRITAGRVVFDRRRDVLYLMRENRGIPRLKIAAGADAIFDGRFGVANRRDRAVMLRGANAGEVLQGSSLFPGVPSGVAGRAAAAVPHVEIDAGIGVPALEVEGLSFKPVLAPYDLFLPCFDLPLADALAALFHRPPFPASPL